VVVVLGPAVIGVAANPVTGASATGLTAAFGGAAATSVSAGAAMVGGAIAGAAGSFVSQGVGLATGIQDKFSWKGVALAAIGGGVSGGISGLGGKIGGFLNADTLVSNVVRGAVGNVLNQGVGLVTGLQSRFSWAGVAVGAVVAGVAGAVSRSLPGRAVFEGGSITQSASIGNQFASGMAGAIAGAATRSAIDGSSFGDNFRAALPDVIGSLIAQVGLSQVRGGGDNLTGDFDMRRLAGIQLASADNVGPEILVLATREQRDRARGLLSTVGDGIEDGIHWLNDRIATHITSRIPSRQQVFDYAYKQSYQYSRNNIITRSLALTGAGAQALGFNGAAKLYGSGAVFAAGVVEGIGNAGIGTVEFGANLTSDPGGTLKGVVSAGARAVDKVIFTPTSEVVAGGRNYAARLASGDPATLRATGNFVGGAAVAIAGAKGFGPSRSASGVMPSLETAYQARYASAYERGLTHVDAELATGKIRAPIGQPEHLFRANRIDSFARGDLRSFAAQLGHGPDVVRINQRLYLNGDTGKFRVPDLYFPQSQTILDGTLGTKSLSTPQVKDFRISTGNKPVGIVRPENYGGFYWIKG